MKAKKGTSKKSTVAPLTVEEKNLVKLVLQSAADIADALAGPAHSEAAERTAAQRKAFREAVEAL